jgi:hypothetical protein
LSWISIGDFDIEVPDLDLVDKNLHRSRFFPFPTVHGYASKVTIRYHSALLVFFQLTKKIKMSFEIGFL